jgi:hypothetical protein
MNSRYLDFLESKIALEFKGVKIGDFLYSLHFIKGQMNDSQSFLIAGSTLFAIKYCAPSSVSQPIKRFNINNILNLCQEYYLSDPISFDQDLRHEFLDQNPIFMILRTMSNQFNFSSGCIQESARSLFLYSEIPNQLESSSGFNFEEKFKLLTKVSVLDFVSVGFLVFVAASQSRFQINPSILLKSMRKRGINLSRDTFICAFDQISADQTKFMSLYQKRKNQDQRFAMYDFNPLITYPVIKPCQGKNFLKDDQQFFYAPIPGLIASRITSGIFYQMFNEYKTNFSDYFGLVFEKYVGLILQRSLFQGTLFSESEIREIYPSKEGMAPDWAFVCEETVILFECKIARFSREAQAIANVEAVNKSLLQIEKGLRQLASFISACRAKHPGLENFHHCNRFIPILISLEPLYLINTSLFRKHIDNTALTAITRYNNNI